MALRILGFVAAILLFPGCKKESVPDGKLSPVYYTIYEWD